MIKIPSRIRKYSRNESTLSYGTAESYNDNNYESQMQQSQTTLKLPLQSQLLQPQLSYMSSQQFTSGTQSQVDDDNGSYTKYNEYPSAPDGGYGWVIVFASFMCNMIVDGIAYAFGVFLGEFVNYFGEGKGKVAWIGSLLSGTYLAVGPIVSALTNRYGCRAVTITGSLIATLAFILSAFFANSIEHLMLAYGVLGGIGFGLIYLPAIVCVGYYFETKRSLATGIAVCGSGFGTFAFAPIARYLIEKYDWRGALLIFSGLTLNCTLFGALMKPLRYPAEENSEFDDEDVLDDVDDEDDDGQPRLNNSSQTRKPLLQRMADEKRLQMERGSIGGSSYFIVQMPDGTKERRPKMPINIDPGVHSNFNLTDFGSSLSPVPTLPTIKESNGTPLAAAPNAPATLNETSFTTTNALPNNETLKEENTEFRQRLNATLAARPDEERLSVDGPTSLPIANDDNKTLNNNNDNNEINDNNDENGDNESAAATTSGLGPKSHSLNVPRTSTFSNSPNFLRKKAAAGAAALNATASAAHIVCDNLPRNASQPAMALHSQILPKNGSVPFFDRIRKTSLNDKYRPILTKIKTTATNTSPSDSNNETLKRNQSRISNIASVFSLSRDQPRPTTPIIRPMSRKDIFYSASIINLPEYQSQKSIGNYRQSVSSLNRQNLYIQTGTEPDEKESPKICCPQWKCLQLVNRYVAQFIDFSLLMNPVFLMIGISNVFGMAGLYVPFVYLVDAAVMDGIESTTASYLISIIGITNTIGRVVCGFIADFPKVDSLFLNNCCLLIATGCVTAIPFCHSFNAYLMVAVVFGCAVAGYISLTSIILVDLLGLDKLTNAFGLLILFRGVAAIIGSPLAGFVYDLTGTYDIPFFMAGMFFAISTLTSFMAPSFKHCLRSKTNSINIDVLEPIDEVENENENGGSGSGRSRSSNDKNTADDIEDEDDDDDNEDDGPIIIVDKQVVRPDSVSAI